MYGAFIGDIVGSKYEFNNIITKQFPLFSPGCDYTDDTIMTVAVAKAILLSREEQFKRGENGKGFQEFLVEVMQDFGQRYPHPTGAYGGSFAKWLRQKNPKPYGSYGNGSAMRVSPCGLAAVTMEEALALARASASVSHDHPEGIKGAEAVSAAVFLAKCGRTKEEIGQYISEHYYNLDFTLDSIRETYKFDGSCQGSVPQAIVAFLESENFEDAIRNVISIGGDCDTTGAIAGSIAWTYYAVQTGSYSGWVYNKFDSAMLEIKAQAMSYLPKEFIDIADEFHEVCWQRAGTFDRVGGCTPILNRDETKKETASPRPKISGGQAYSLAYIRGYEGIKREHHAGARYAWHDKTLGEWRLTIQLDNQGIWFLSVFVKEDGRFEKYSLDYEMASDFHYEFRDEKGLRKKIYSSGDEKKYLAEVLIRYVQMNGGNALLSALHPFITAQYHYD